MLHVVEGFDHEVLALVDEALPNLGYLALGHV